MESGSIEEFMFKGFYSELTKNNNLDTSKLLDGLLYGITDIIGVYKPNGEIVLYNYEGYKFFHITPADTIGKKCYEMLGRACRCETCSTQVAMRERKLIRIVKFFPELNRHMDCRCNPIMDEAGEILFFIEQMTDITEKLEFDRTLKESEEKYRTMVELSPDGILVISDGKIVLANNEAAKIYGTRKEELLGTQALDIIVPDYREKISEKMKSILSQKTLKSTSEYKIYNYYKEELDVQISSGYLMYNDKPAIQSVIRNITEFNKGMNSAALVQRQSLPTVFPLLEKAFIDGIYVPAKTVSGDNYLLNKLDDNTVSGIIFDVSGKGITAALNISAVNVLYNQAIRKYRTPMGIIKYMNHKAVDYLGESYVAACCFLFDFRSNTANIVGAGINNFVIAGQNEEPNEIIVKGAFVGMFENSEFDEFIYRFESGDKFFFYTDGFEELFDMKEFLQSLGTEAGISQSAKAINDYLEYINPVIHVHKDDCTLLAIQIK